MKKWVAMLLTFGITGATAVIPAIGDENMQKAASMIAALIVGYIAKKTSESNPDGTSAKVAYREKLDENLYQ